MIDGNDGGLNITRDGGKTWYFAENIPVGQWYHINVDNEVPYNIYGGLQDNGSWVGPAYVWRRDGIRNTYWQEINSVMVLMSFLILLIQDLVIPCHREEMYPL
jgi:hypothetical protein